jgi:RimJ/RimL family protein N-acetyltransferase
MPAGGLVRLRPTTEGDLAFVVRTEGDGENVPFIGRWTRERHLESLSDGRTSHMILERTGTGESIGYVVLTGFDNPDRTVCLKRLVVAEKGHGHGRSAVKLVKRLAFEEAGAHRLWLDVKERNLRARRLYESEGFVFEGTLRDAFWRGEEYESLVVMSILEKEYVA